jgi:hypothetical protein
MGFLQTTTIIAIVGFLMSYMAVSAKKQSIIDDEGTLILRMHRAYGIIGYILIAIFTIISVTVSLKMVDNINEFIDVAELVISLDSIGFFMVVYSRNCRLEVTKDSIRQCNVLGMTKEINWDDVKDVSFNKTAMELKLASERLSIKVHMHMTGFLDLVSFMENNLDERHLQCAATSINMVQEDYLEEKVS